MRHSVRRLRSLLHLLTGRPIFEAGHYREADALRLVNLFAHVDLERWRGYRVLEVGAGLGNIGQVFRHLGFDVTSSDGRPQHVARMQERGIPARVLDLDGTGVDELGDFEIILAFGVLYHLEEPERFLLGCGKRARVLLLESAVLDHPEAVVRPVSEARGLRGQDQALRGRGCRPSPAWVEATCRAAGFDDVRDISNPVANWSIGRFDWEVRGDGTWRREGSNHRKMWVCEKRSASQPSVGG